MIIAVFSRVLRQGMTVQDLVAAWKPHIDGVYPADVEVAVDPSNDLRVITIIRFDGSMQQFNDAIPRLLRPDAAARVAEVIASTELESVYESVDVSL